MCEVKRVILGNGLDGVIEKGTFADLDELEILYNELLDYQYATKNYSNWTKGHYPIRDTARLALEDKSLFVLRLDGKIAGSIVLNHRQEKAYSEVTWGIDVKDDEVMVVHTFVVRPSFLNRGIGQRLLVFAKDYAKLRRIKTMRLGTSIGNLPAQHLYEKNGYSCVGTVDLKLSFHDKVFINKLYEFIF